MSVLLWKVFEVGMEDYFTVIIKSHNVIMSNKTVSRVIKQ